jgi:hypothetical protein
VEISRLQLLRDDFEVLVFLKCSLDSSIVSSKGMLSAGLLSMPRLNNSRASPKTICTWKRHRLSALDRSLCGCDCTYPHPSFKSRRNPSGEQSRHGPYCPEPILKSSQSQARVWQYSNYLPDDSRLPDLARASSIPASLEKMICYPRRMVEPKKKRGGSLCRFHSPLPLLKTTIKFLTQV